MASWLDRLKQGLSKTRDILNTDIEDLFKGGKKLDGNMLEQLEEILITADIGVQTTMTLMEKVSRAKVEDADGVKAVLKKEILSLMKPASDIQKPLSQPHVIMIVGVNGVGKTTTIGKLAAKIFIRRQKVLIAAADTFRAAAIEQIAIWAERAGVDIVRHKDNADPAAVAFDGVESAVARKKDIVIVDTAGRLHTRVNLMEEVKKIKRAITKKIADAPHEVWLVLDATTGQNALSQAKQFNEDLGVTGLILTKLDGTAKGGVVISITNSLNIPLKYIGVGEGIDDLQTFDAAQFVEALF
ncbi:MAG: signal recognition particle-docking protein FtsY [Desulfobacteraceae bacterium]|nr:signal recognition particle-docking protein FtsY [Desulfobacteraceae bacterium]